MSLENEKRRQTYWDTEMVSYRRRRHGAFTWPIILAILMVVGMVAILLRLYGLPFLEDLSEEASVILIEPTQDIIKRLPDDPGGHIIPHQDKFIYNSIDGSKPLTALGADYQANMIRREPEPPLNVEKVLESKAASKVKAATRRAEGLLQDVIVQGVKRFRTTEGKELQPSKSGQQKGAKTDEVRLPGPVQVLEGDITVGLGSERIVDIVDIEAIIKQNKGVPSPPKPVYVVQTSAMYTAEAAEKEWGIQLREQPHLLAAMPHKVCEHTIKGYGQLHRLYVGSFTSYQAARDFCAELKKHDIDCFAREVPLDYRSCLPS